jgi:hypothetical protein
VARPWYERDGPGGPCDHAHVPSEFLPPDPYADAQQEGGRSVFAPPGTVAAKPERNRAVLALALGAAALGLLALSSGVLFPATLPACIAAWVLGRRATQAAGGSDQGNVAVIMGIVGTVLSLIAAGVWIAIWA